MHDVSALIENEVNSLFSEFEVALNGASHAHRKIKKLVTQTENLLNLHKSTMQPESIQAANGMLGELNGLLSDARIKQNEYDLLTKAIEVIGKYEASLEASPGFWNQFKAVVNNFVEGLTGEKDAIFSVQKTAVGADKDFQSYKNSIKGLKTKMEQEEPDNSHRPKK